MFVWHSVIDMAIHSGQGHSIAIAKLIRKLIRTCFKTHPEGSLYFWEYPNKAFYPCWGPQRGYQNLLPNWGTDTRFIQHVEAKKKQQELPRRVGHRLNQRQHQGTVLPDYQDKWTQRIPTNVRKRGNMAISLRSLSPFVWTTRTILNHAPIGEYRIRFHPKSQSHACVANQTLRLEPIYLQSAPGSQKTEWHYPPCT